MIVTHELASIFTIANNCVFLDAESRTQIATGDPKELLAHSNDPRVLSFLTRGKEGEPATQIMSKQFSPTAIGSFVVGSFALLLPAIVVVGSGKLFQKPVQFICFFHGDVNGLKVGAPVKFRGVQIGSVTDIKLVLSPKEGQLKQDKTGIWLPVIIEIDRTMLIGRGGTGEALTQIGMNAMIQRGMRAQLSVESFLTGLLYVDLDLHPNAPLDLALQPGGQLREIPTIPTTLESVQRQAGEALAKFQQIDFKALAVSITEAANSIKTLSSSPQLMATLNSLKDAAANMNVTITAMRGTINNINGHIDPLMASLRGTRRKLTPRSNRPGLRSSRPKRCSIRIHRWPFISIRRWNS